MFLVKSLQNDCQKFLEARASRRANPIEYNTSQRQLLDHLKGMPERFNAGPSPGSDCELTNSGVRLGFDLG